MNDLYLRFGLEAKLKESEKMFRNKLMNIFSHGKLGSDIFERSDGNNISWTLHNKLGLRYYSFDNDAKSLFHDSMELREYFFRLQVLLDCLWELGEQDKDRSLNLGSLINEYLEESPIELGYIVKVYKTKAPQIYPSKTKKSHKSIIKTLDLVESDDRFKEVFEHLEAGLKELMGASTKAQLKDVVEDLSTACDALIKVRFKDQNLGFKHLFKDDRWKKAKLTDAQKRIYSDLNKLMDQIKHGVVKSFDKDDIDIIVYLSSELISRIVSSYGT